MTDHLPLFAPQFGGSFPPPRPWQDAAHEALREGARNGHRCQLLMAPTGSGKTYQAMRIIHEALLKHKRAMFVCDRKTLINQTSSVASDYGLHAHGIIQAQNPKMDPRKHFQIGSLQTLAMRGWPDTDVVIIDEAHTQYKTWRDYIKNHPETRVIGLSATPFSVGLGRLFTNLVNVTTMDALTKEGILVPMRIYTCHRPDMRGAATQGGEWTDAAAAERELAIVGDVVSEWTKLGEGRKSICFGATIAHCEEIARRFNEAGIRAATFTAKTTEEERRGILEEFGDRPGEIHILVSVEALAKGFDVKDVGCILDCRPLRKSLSTAIQMWGRGLRSSPETAKKDCILLDFSGNIIRFSDDFSDVYFNGLSHLDQGEKLDKTIRKDEEKGIRKCPQCGFQPVGKTCIMCGYQAKRTNLVQHQAGTMEAFAIGQKVYAESKADLYAQLAAYAKIHSLPERVKGRTAHLYKDFVGVWPPNGWDPYTVPEVRPSRETMNKIRSLTIAFSKRRTA